ncbi:hypothetical protein SD78_2804 [Bacillus badius]|nr:hypothetical protein SD78_2804 [Bacillus badius]
MNHSLAFEECLLLTHHKNHIMILSIDRFFCFPGRDFDDE